MNSSRFLEPCSSSSFWSLRDTACESKPCYPFDYSLAETCSCFELVPRYSAT